MTISELENELAKYPDLDGIRVTLDEMLREVPKFHGELHTCAEWCWLLGRSAQLTKCMEGKN